MKHQVTFLEYFNFFPILFCSQWKSSQNISTQLPEKCLMLVLCSWNTILTSNRPRLLCQDYTKHNTETNTYYGSKRSQDLHMCHWKPTPAHIPDWKTNEPQNMFRNMYADIFVCWKFRRTKYAQIVQVNRSVCKFSGQLVPSVWFPLSLSV